MSKISQSVVSRDAHIKFVSALVVKGDAAAIAILSSPVALAQDYVAFADRQARNHKIQFVDVVGVLSQDDLDSLRKSLPKDSVERDRFLEACKSVVSPSEFQLYDAGELTIGKDLSKCAMIVASATIDGKKTKVMFGLKKWHWIANLSAPELDSIRDLLSAAEKRGMK